MGVGATARASRRGAHDLTYGEGPFTYRDSYFGGTAFAGQEVVWQSGRPVWAMNYWGRVLEPAAIDGARAAMVIRAAMTAMYATGRFLGGWDHVHCDYLYQDRSAGDHADFTGYKVILSAGRVVYRLDYHGGLLVA